MKKKYGKIKELKIENRDLRKENKELKRKNEELKAMVDDLRRMIFRRRKKKKEAEGAPGRDEKSKTKTKKKGAPFGHEGTTRAKPKHIDEEIKVIPPVVCSYCGSHELELTALKEEHIQEEIVIPKKKVTKYIKTVCRCKKCKRLVRGVGDGEMQGSYIGPQTKAIANYLRFDIGISQNKLQRIFKELFRLPFHQTSVAGFENQLRKRSQNIYNEMQMLLHKAKLLYIDETGWKKDGFPYWLWCFCNAAMAFYHIDKSRGGKVIKNILGKKFSGIILSDFLSAYNTIDSKKQKCLVHILRAIKRLDAACGSDKEVAVFCLKFKKIIKRIIHLFNNRKRIPDYVTHRAYIIAQCKRLLSKQFSHKKLERWRNTLNQHIEELYTCLFHSWADSNNNFVERMLRPNVIMRKLTFGNRSDNGIKNHSVIMSLLKTAKLNKRYPPDIFRQILTPPSKISLSNIIRAP